MASEIFFKRPWTGPPPIGTPIDKSSPLGRGLAAFVYPGAKSIYDAVSNRYGHINADTALGSFTSRGITNTGIPGVDLGIGTLLPNPGSEFPPAFTIFGLNIPTGDKFTMAMAATLAGSTTAGGSPPIFTLRNEANDRFAQMRLQNEPFAANDRHPEWHVDFVNAGITCEIEATSETLGIGDTGIVVASCDTVDNFTEMLNPDGSTTINIVTATTANPTMTRIVVDQIGDFSVHFHVGAFWNDRELTLLEKKSFQANPWQVFEPKKILMPVVRDKELRVF